MDIDTGAQQGSRYHYARFDEKGCLQVWGGDVIKGNSCRLTTPRGHSLSSPHQRACHVSAQMQGYIGSCPLRNTYQF